MTPIHLLMEAQSEFNAACRKGKFTLRARYTDDSPVPEGFDRTIGTYEVSTVQLSLSLFL